MTASPKGMIVVRAVGDIGFRKESVVTVGTFDGVHAGHRSIIAEMLRRARESGSRSIVVTFDPHPRTVVGRGPVHLLTTLAERIDLIGEMGVDAVLVLPFTYEFSRQTPREFYERYLLRGTGVREVVIGHDHMFGRDREAGRRELGELGREFGFAVTVVGPVTIGGDLVSSSKIRELLQSGEVERAALLLGGRPYGLDGTVVRGEGRGVRIGFPTANLQTASGEKIIPGNGVYLVSAAGEGRRTWYGMMNIGTRPTFDDGKGSVLEVHLFDFSGDLYGKRLRIGFLKRLRAEKKFATAEALIAQLRQDRTDSLNLITAFHRHQ